MAESVLQWEMCVCGSLFLSAGLLTKQEAARCLASHRYPRNITLTVGTQGSASTKRTITTSVRKERSVALTWSLLTPSRAQGVSEAATWGRCVCAETLRPRAARSRGCWWCSAFSRAALLPGKLWIDGAVTLRCDWLARCGAWAGRGYRTQ